MWENLEALLQKADVPNTERAEMLWAEYRTGESRAEAAFNVLLAWYGLALYRHIWGFVRSDAADDVFQDLLVKLHQERRKLATFEQALRWLRTVAIRKCIDANRGQRGEKNAKRRGRSRLTLRP
jgi:DNA-directed RNA polymerase specialized sigma24 family protein